MVRFVRGDGNFHFRTEFGKPTGHEQRCLVRPENKDLKFERGWSPGYRFGCPKCVCISWDPD